MKITYFAIVLATTILSREVVAQEETPTPSLSTDSRIEAPQIPKKPAPATYRPPPDATYKPTPWPLRKKPTPTPYRPKPNTTLNPPPYRPRPDTTSRITPTPVPGTPFDPFSGRGPHPAGSNRTTFTFPSGVRVQIETLGDDVAFTYADGHRSVEHKHDLNDHKPTGAHPWDCQTMRYILFHSNPKTSAWRRLCVEYINGC